MKEKLIAILKDLIARNKAGMRKMDSFMQKQINAATDSDLADRLRIKKSMRAHDIQRTIKAYQKVMKKIRELV